MAELSIQQIDFLNYYTNPKSETFGNALQSALKANYSQEYAESITYKMPDWLAENVGRRMRLLEQAEKNLEDLLISKNDNIKADITKFVTKTLGKEHYSERSEHTGKDGKDLPTPIIQLNAIQPDDSNKPNNSTD